ncbi:MAG: tRNA uridine-5-carboxymethylaminomethyl(34) synthesis GTPase MnmE [Xanthomonadales bacterium]|nr:tRNA modification GTPase MnmE [Xanthomonadales bacterium]MCC6594655.1 tRNA uridine-5-carboxymethylaminomethyl(34) synthesis GTPase MnmE [Xanthomonadales bacterium]MCE7931474.1 tRNA uridine-5-carboxymethylaminomethyl(34) synthesis GTPase MnmE [Xanthomonadales bacterium PRO6]
MPAPSPVTDTIAAIATPAGSGGIGVLRLSGPQALAIARVFLGSPAKPRHAHRCRFRDAGGDVIDDGLLLAFPAPHSYTGEDVVELQAHGAPVLLAALLRRCIELGARHARPGEFSERAFLNGKLDLAQAEAVADLIAAGSEAAARAAMRSLDGEFSRRVHALGRQLVELRVYIEAAIDFPEEEIDFLRGDELRARFAAVDLILHELLAGARRGQRLRDGLRVAILGEPNVGKSSLLNALAGHDRAIVTAIPGTTRDVLLEHLDVDGLPVTVVDTAGLRETTDEVESEGIARARREAAKADLVLWVVDESRDSGPGARGAASSRITVHNKLDLSDAEARIERRADGTHVHLSAKTGAGLPLLRRVLREHAGLTEGSAGDFSARARHVDALERCRAALATARAQALTDGHGELAAEELRIAHEALGEITGRMRADELLGAIFASFCIGK